MSYARRGRIFCRLATLASGQMVRHTVGFVISSPDPRINLVIVARSRVDKLRYYNSFTFSLNCIKKSFIRTTVINLLSLQQRLIIIVSFDVYNG